MKTVLERTETRNSFKPFFDLVAVAASAGGLHALSALLSGIPANFPAAVVIVQHLHPGRPTVIVQILSKWSKLPVKQAEENDLIEAWSQIKTASRGN